MTHETETADPSAQTAPSDGLRPETASPMDGADALKQLQAEKAELKDRLLRTLAEMENLRRRTERDVADARSYAIAKFAAEMVAVADNMRRAIAAVPAEARDGNDAVLKALVDGADLTEREMLRALEKHGVKQIDPKGERFDPHFHQAMFEVPDDSVPS